MYDRSQNAIENQKEITKKKKKKVNKKKRKKENRKKRNSSSTTPSRLKRAFITKKEKNTKQTPHV